LLMMADAELRQQQEELAAATERLAAREANLRQEEQRLREQANNREEDFHRRQEELERQLTDELRQIRETRRVDAPAVLDLLREQNENQIQMLRVVQQGVRRDRERPEETVRLTDYDGTTDVEDFIALFNHIADLYNWDNALKLAKLKTSLAGKAAECSRPATTAGVIEALRNRFGITPAEAKRSLAAMKTGQTERLREMAEKIRKLTDLAYPGVNADIKATLALDQYKRCVSSELSVFMVSRPPNDLDEAVRICGEYTSAGGRTKTKASISALEMTAGGDTKTANTTASGQSDSNTELKELVKMMKGMMELMMKIQEEANKNQQSAATLRPEWLKPLQPQRPTEPFTPAGRKPKPPPSPCYACGQMHWYQDCPQKPRVRQQKTNITQNSNKRPGSITGQGNFQGPRQ
jgi:multidrug efflux pump subunit AcrA (membrane-fusion protein)